MTKTDVKKRYLRVECDWVKGAVRKCDRQIGTLKCTFHMTSCSYFLHSFRRYSIYIIDTTLLHST